MKQLMRSLMRPIAAIVLAIAYWASSSSTGAMASNFTPPLLVAEVEFKYRNAGDDKIDEIGDKIDLNNANIREFRDLRGFFPNLAAAIIRNAPYNKVRDVLEIPDISDRQRKRLEDNLDQFVVTDPSYIFNEGDERYNPGIYN